MHLRSCAGRGPGSCVGRELVGFYYRWLFLVVPGEVIGSLMVGLSAAGSLTKVLKFTILIASSLFITAPTLDPPTPLEGFQMFVYLYIFITRALVSRHKYVSTYTLFLDTSCCSSFQHQDVNVCFMDLSKKKNVCFMG